VCRSFIHHALRVGVASTDSNLRLKKKGRSSTSLHSHEGGPLQSERSDASPSPQRHSVMHGERCEPPAHDEPEDIEGRVHVAASRVATVGLRTAKHPRRPEAEVQLGATPACQACVHFRTDDKRLPEQLALGRQQLPERVVYQSQESLVGRVRSAVAWLQHLFAPELGQDDRVVVGRQE